ncbi:metal ABC transporter permease [Corynebacterium hindlerae]|uniref:Metal ABC transporter permease n=1 Tax=Corynebacterium hindlerae TaxID=699041 RepID=A0A7G5FHE9_9CORY|nr:metal ABC transporter permease [Corynebacterium hindlerae]QMV86040.1 metal ABC transporter permease [Corynebacterium hindlerae]
MISVLPIVEVTVLGASTAAVGALATMHRKVFFAEAITHATFPGAVLGVVISATVLPQLSTYGQSLCLFLGGFLMCIPLSALMRRLAQVPGISSPAAAGIVLTFGFGLGYFLAKWFQPLPIRVDTFLTGSALTVNRADVTAAGLLLIVVAVACALVWWPLVFRAFDPGVVKHGGTVIDALVLFLICLAVTVAIPAVGTIVPIALLAAPAGVGWALAREPGTFVLISVITGVLMGLIGLTVGVMGGISVGGAIALTGGLLYAIARSAALLWRNARL